MIDRLPCVVRLRTSGTAAFTGFATRLVHTWRCVARFHIDVAVVDNGVNAVGELLQRVSRFRRGASSGGEHGENKGWKFQKVGACRA